MATKKGLNIQMKAVDKDGKYMSTVKVGPKGQIVIPKEIREMFDIASGDSLVILADRERGIAIQQSSFFNHMADAIFAGKGTQLYPEYTEDETMNFAKEIKNITRKENE